MVDTPLKKQNRQNMYFGDYSKFNTESYPHNIHTIDWNAITVQCNDLHEVTARTIDSTELIVEKHVPKRKKSRNQQRFLKQSWLRREIIESIKSRHTISEFGVPAVDHKIACDWERVGIKVASICSS